MSRRIMRWLKLGACCAAVASYASQPVPAKDGTVCGPALPGMSPPFVCPIGKDANPTVGRSADEGRQ